MNGYKAIADAYRTYLNRNELSEETKGSIKKR